MKKIIISILLIFLFAGCQNIQDSVFKWRGGKKAPKFTEEQLAVKKSQELYKKLKAEGINFSDGPCISNEIIPGWVADIAHSPRQPIDNISKNQCSAYRQGKAKHFVELDPDGNFIRAF